MAHEQREDESTFARLQATLKWLAFSLMERPSLPGACFLGLFSDRLCILNKVLLMAVHSLLLKLVTEGL